jgi:hypothetical protein
MTRVRTKGGGYSCQTQGCFIHHIFFDRRGRVIGIIYTTVIATLGVREVPRNLYPQKQMLRATL